MIYNNRKTCKPPYARLQGCKIARNEFMMIKEQCPAITG